jgi:hypothetical protein
MLVYLLFYSLNNTLSFLFIILRCLLTALDTLIRAKRLNVMFFSIAFGHLALIILPMRIMTVSLLTLLMLMIMRVTMNDSR